MGFIRTLLWFFLFVFCTFCWFVLFEHSFHVGTFFADAKDEYHNLMQQIQGKPAASADPVEPPAGR